MKSVLVLIMLILSWFGSPGQESIYSMISASDVPPEISRLAQNIVSGQTGDSARVTALFHWVTDNIRYDQQAIGGDRINHSTLDVINRGRAICYGYSQLMQQLCVALDIPAHVISGYSGPKGNARANGAPDHAWNAVRIEGHWQLLDATWGVTYSRGGKNKESAPWLFVDPSDFTRTHLPAQPIWQLTDCPVGPDPAQRLVCGYLDSLNAYLSLGPDERKLTDARMAYDFHSSEDNKREYAQTLIDLAVKEKEHADALPADSSVTIYMSTIHKFRHAAVLQADWFDWQSQAFAFALLNLAQIQLVRLEPEHITEENLKEMRDMLTQADDLMAGVQGTFGLNDARAQCRVFIAQIDRSLANLRQ